MVRSLPSARDSSGQSKQKLNKREHIPPQQRHPMRDDYVEMPHYAAPTMPFYGARSMPAPRRDGLAYHPG